MAVAERQVSSGCATMNSFTRSAPRMILMGVIGFFDPLLREGQVERSLEFAIPSAVEWYNHLNSLRM